MEVSNTPVPAPADMEDEGTIDKRFGSDDDMDEGSDADWDNVASGSDNGCGGNGDGDQQEVDDSGDDSDEEERDLIILCSMSLGREQLYCRPWRTERCVRVDAVCFGPRWERYEASVEAAMEAETGKQALSSTQGLAARRQIFNPREAFSMLSRELLDCLRARNVDCSVETGGDDLYHWIVDLGSFTEGSALAKDMREVSRRYFYSTVRLRLRFMRGLHPFFPPSVEVVWPHFKGPMLDAVASHPMLRLENWDPWRAAMDTVGQIKAFLEANARVDLDNPANDIRLHPHSTYSPLERGLARLEALSGVSPLSLQQPEVAALYAARDSYDKDTARLQALAEAGKKRGRPELASGKRTREVVWARGTGYGSGQEKNSEQWDAKATDAAQRARDSEIQLLLEELYNSLVRELGPRPPLLEEREDTQRQKPQGQQEEEQRNQQLQEADDGTGPAAMEGVETTAASAGAAQEPPETPEPAGTGGVRNAAVAVTAVEADAPVGAAPACSHGDDTEPRLGAERCAAVLQDSCLLPFVVRELHLASFTDMGARHKYYLALLALLRELCRPSTHDMLWSEVGPQGQASSEPAGPGHSVAAILTKALRSAAKLYLSVLGPATVRAEKGTGSAESGASTSAAVTATRIPDRSAVAAENAAREAEATQRMARIIMQIAAYIDANMPGRGAPAAEVASAVQGPHKYPQPQAEASVATGAALAAERTASGAQASTSAAGAASASADGPSLYVKTFKPLQVDAVSGLGRAHHFANQTRMEQQAPRIRAVRLAKEVASLESLLPLSESSSVFARVDETAVQLWKTLIVGPEDTPYSGGCFVFDMYFPPQYPNVPPQVHLMTTGGGRVRFNPNLYAEGKVCLSLLGTWSGDRGETWNPDISTAVQVLISIQSLIMVPEPYFNEPSYESQTGDRGKTASQEYNKNVRENCVRYAMLDVLRHPPTALAEVVRTHFRLRRDALLTQIKIWADDARPADSAYAARMMDMRRDLETLIAAL
ncbi:hypothetical protein VaNZ11_008953 [Volvox africanus]|uniref:UBC core domain-containing protein n=1 Tax=Volvox africanus TaxID=51714 RepID=A0ABQ5S672_9CHLO|nr:hypothetical protein VaNZ11_008953 [Volvox africanus]